MELVQHPQHPQQPGTMQQPENMQSPSSLQQHHSQPAQPGQPAQPMTAQPMAQAQPMMSQPMAAQPMAAQPMQAGPSMAQAQPMQATATHSGMPTESKESQVYRIADQLFQRKPDWVTFYREVLGIEGVVRRAYPNQPELLQFETTREYSDIQQMVAKLRERAGEPAENREPTRVITVRLPKSLHETLRTEAHERKTSMNKLCISKLLQMVDNELIPSD